MRLYDLDFADLFLPAGSAGWYKTAASDGAGHGVPPECCDEATALRAYLIDHLGGDGGRVEWASEPSAPPLRLRVQRMNTIADGPVFVCRRPLDRVFSLASLGFPLPIANVLLSDALSDGLILFMGQTGAGKTTTASAFVVERISRQGGVCWTIESPVEMLLQGAHGRGRIYQCEVPNEAAFGPALSGVLRAAPDHVFIGELRDHDATAEATIAAATGHLLTATFHAPSLTAGLERYAEKCGSAANLASALRAAFHLQLRTANDPGAPRRPPAAGQGQIAPPARRLSVAPLLVHGAGADGIRSLIRSGQFHQLSSEIDRQKRQLIGGLA